MNIFFLDVSPRRAAQYHCDIHVNKMITESLQMMSVALHHFGLLTPLKKDGNHYSHRSHINHPCTKWVRESVDNFLWTYDLTQYLCEEFEKRNKKRHAGANSLETIDVYKLIETMPSKGLTAPALAMPEEFKTPTSPVLSYRTFYNHDKWEFAKWKYTTTPEWWAPACVITGDK